MEKIKNTFLKIYSGECVLERHLLYALILLLSSLSTAAFNLVDKDNSNTINAIYGITGLILLPITIIGMITALGFFVKFFHNKLNNEAVVFPYLNFDCFKKGFKSIPMVIVWSIYYILLMILFVGIIIAAVYGITQAGGNIAAIILYVLFILFILFVLIAALVLSAPFINIIYIKFAKNFQYSSEIFSIMTVINFMKKAFKPVFIVAVKYMLVSIICNMIIYTVIAMLLIPFIGIITILNESFMNSHAGMLVMYIGTLFVTVIIGYITGIISFAFVDNVCDVYKEEYEPIETQL